MARPTKLTPELSERIIDAVRAGNFLETAAAFAGVSRSTLRLWLRHGRRQKKGALREFSDAVKRAQAEAEVRDLDTIRRASADQWQAAAWRLERKLPRRWGRKHPYEDQLAALVQSVVNLKSQIEELKRG